MDMEIHVSSQACSSDGLHQTTFVCFLNYCKGKQFHDAMTILPQNCVRAMTGMRLNSSNFLHASLVAGLVL